MGVNSKFESRNFRFLIILPTAVLCVLGSVQLGVLAGLVVYILVLFFAVAVSGYIIDDLNGKNSNPWVFLILSWLFQIGAFYLLVLVFGVAGGMQRNRYNKLV